MDPTLAVRFDDLADVDLLVERVYRGRAAGRTGDDPLTRLLPGSDQGGFRTYGSVARNAVRLTLTMGVFTGIAWWYDGLHRAMVRVTSREAAPVRSVQARVSAGSGWDR